MLLFIVIFLFNLYVSSPRRSMSTRTRWDKPQQRFTNKRKQHFDSDRLPEFKTIASKPLDESTYRLVAGIVNVNGDHGGNYLVLSKVDAYGEQPIIKRSLYLCKRHWKTLRDNFQVIDELVQRFIPGIELFIPLICDI